MKPQNSSNARTKLARILMIVLIFTAIPLAMIGIFFIAIGISNGAVMGIDLLYFKRSEYIGKGMFMSIFGIAMVTMSYWQLKKARSKGQ